MAVRFCTLFSGSKGNSAFIEHTAENGKKTAILIDAGKGVKVTQKALQNIGSSLSEISAIFITHEHSDHIGGLKTILKNYDIPVISDKRILDKIIEKQDGCQSARFFPMPSGSRAENSVFAVTSFDSPHDSTHCCGYKIEVDGVKLGYLTDCGEFDEKHALILEDCQALILEANHDPKMLKEGPYSYPLKMRIASSRGHLSNYQCGNALCRLCRGNVKKVILAHLSEENNLPSLAYNTVCNILSGENLQEGKDVSVYVAPPCECSEILEF